MTDEYNDDLYPFPPDAPRDDEDFEEIEQRGESGQLGIPEREDCDDGVIPDKTEPSDGKKKVMAPEVISMTWYLFKNYRLPMYSYVNRCLRDGSLLRLIGMPVKNRVFNRETCSFPHVAYWKIDRENFYADVQVKLQLETWQGKKEWTGYLVFWCSFEENDFVCTIETLTDQVDREDDALVLLSPYLVPYYTSKKMDEVTENIWGGLIPEALINPAARLAHELAKRMGLTIQYHPVYEHKGVDSILFFAEDDLVVGADRFEKGEDGKKEYVKDKAGKTVRIPANTIVVNTNRIKRDYSAFNIYHECIHYEEHYMFFRLQAMNTNDVRKVKMVEVEIDPKKELNDPIYFMEKQANRGAYGLMMPATYTSRQIAEEAKKVKEYRHYGEQLEIVGKALSTKLGLPHFRVRARMIQLGNVHAKGSLNYVERKLIQPFAFDIDAWREDQHTFVVDRGTVNLLYRTNDDFRAIMDTGHYVYADGHVVRNTPRFVRREGDDLLLTDLANKRVDECCLRFVRVYKQEGIGRYVFGRMFYDADYIRQTLFYLNDLINQENLDELDAKEIYIQRFPRSFKEAVVELKKKNGATNAKLAEFFNMDDATFGRWLDDPKRYRNEDFLTMLCLYFKLPDWLSSLVFKRAHFQLDEEDKRHRALLHILRVQSEEGVEAANAYLAKYNLPPLSI